MSGTGVPAHPDRVIHRFPAWSQMPVQDVVTLRRSLRRSTAAVPGHTIERELLSMVEEEIVRRGLEAADKAHGPPAGS